MRATLSLIRREFSAYFLSPIAYVVLTVFLVVMGVMFLRTLDELTADGPRGVEFPMQMMLGLGDFQSLPGVLSFLAFWLVMLIVPPLLTMRLFAEERSSGTLEMLLTSPLRDWQIVFGKFAACLGFYVVLWLPTLLYLPVLLAPNSDELATPVDSMSFLTTYVGVLLVGAMFISIGLFISSLWKSQMAAALTSLFVSLVFIAAGLWLNEQAVLDTTSPLYLSLSYFTVPLHFERNFTRGLIDTRQLVLYLSVTLFCLFLTVRSLESRRWR